MTPIRQQLAAVLAAYNASPPERTYLTEMRHLVAEAGDVTSRVWFEPGHFTVSGFVTDPAISSVVLIRHRRLDRWLQPGGHIDHSDVSLEATLAREIAEETGLIDLEPRHPSLFDIDVHTVPAHLAEPAHRHYDLRFHVLARGSDLAVSEDVDGAAWVGLDHVAEWTTDGSVLRTVTKLEALHEALQSRRRDQRR